VVSRLKVNTAAFIFQVAASLSYILLYLQGIGYPLALFSILMFVVRIIIGVAVLVNSRKAHYVSVAGSAIGFVYIALSFFASNSILVTLPLALEIGALVATLESLSKIGKTKQPSPLDMPVYG
jgi:hypothetical protein